MFWVNPNINLIIDSEITEYDIKSGNVSIMRVFKDQFDPPLKEDQIDQIASLDKKARVIRVGNMMKDYPGFSKTLEKGFNTVIYTFCQENGLDMSENSEDATSIKRDAIFVVKKKISHTCILKYCNFIPKNVYDGYIRIKGYEFYIDFPNKKIDVKGLSDDKIPLHQDGMIWLLLSIYEEAKKQIMNREKVSRYLADVCDAYLSKDLPLECYRQFDNESKFKLSMGSMDYFSDQIQETDVQDLDIEFNYRMILIPLLKVFL